MGRLSYREIKRNYGSPYGKGSVFIDFYACALSPLITIIALKFHLIPNTVTLGMIVSGIAGATVFWIPNPTIRIIGVFFIHLWYILDCSDGEVARINNHFSKYGKELDYMAHTINHPLFSISFLIALYLDGLFDYKVLICVLMTISADSVLRMVYTFRYIDAIRLGTKESARAEKGRLSTKEMILFILNIFAQFPNFALIYPVVYLINREAGMIYLYINTTMAFLYSAHVSISWLRTIHKY